MRIILTILGLCLALFCLMLALGVIGEAESLTECEQVCAASCKRGKECFYDHIDCGTICEIACSGIPNGDGTNVAACITAIKALNCIEIKQLVFGDISVIKEECGW